MIILIIGNSSGSILGFRMPLIMELKKRGAKVVVIANDFSNDDINHLNSINIDAYNFHLNNSSINLLSEVKTIFSIYKLIKKIKPDYVFSYFTKPVIYGSLAAKFANIKNITGMVEGLGITYTNPPEGISFKLKCIRFIQTVLFKSTRVCCDNIIVLNSDDYDFFHQKIKHKNIYNIGGIGVDLTDFCFNKIDKNKLKFIFIGRLFKEKGIFNFLNAAEILKKKYPDIEFIVLGGIDEKNLNSISKIELENYVKNGIITYPGLVSNVQDYLIKSSVLVLPSYYREGLPRSIQESLAIGRPVITSTTAGCRQSICDYETGFLIDPYSKSSLFNVMKFIITNKFILDEMSLKSRLFAENKYDINKINQVIMSVIVNEE